MVFLGRLEKERERKRKRERERERFDRFMHVLAGVFRVSLDIYKKASHF